MGKKAVALLLVNFLLASQSLAQTTLKPLDPKTCYSLSEPCTCFTPESLDKIAAQIRIADRCQYEINEYESFTEVQQQQAWYSDPKVIIGGVTVSLAVGGLIGYLVAKK